MRCIKYIKFLTRQNIIFMKQIAFMSRMMGLFVILLLMKGLQAQTPEKIQRITIVQMPNEYYVVQAKLWKKVLEKDAKNADAWYNYYKANRYMQITSQDDYNAFEVDRFKRLAAIEKEIETNIPNTFEANLIKWVNGGSNPELFPYLEKAYNIDPSRVETYDNFVTYYELQGNIEKRDFFLKKWYNSGEVSPGLLNYNYNVLMSLKPNAILLTNGDNDTYPIWLLQTVKGIRKDVTLINISMLYSEDYRERLVKKMQITLIDPTESREKDIAFSKNLVPTLAKNVQKSPVYTASTCIPSISESVEKDLYLVGLASLYSTEKFDNVAVLKKNMEKEFAMDYLKTSFVIDKAETAVSCANMNYVVPILSLYEHYDLSEEKEKANEWKQLVIKIAKGTEMEGKVRDYFKEK